LGNRLDEVKDMAGRFGERNVFVTGAGGGIGARIAERLAAEGAAVAVVDIDANGAAATVNAIANAGGRAHPLQADVSSATSVERAADAAERVLGPLTMAVTAAGILHVAPFLELSETSWDRTINVNLKGTFLTVQAVARRMVSGGRRGAMVCVSSVAGRGGRADTADYAASKAGVISVVRSAALALAGSRITVNAICPGVVDTRMTRMIHEQRAQDAGISPEESLASMLPKIPLGRIETTDDVADAVLFLLSDDSSYITGQALNVCGGMEFD
jgi:NAD(P)-dependent dehydrogenase (short-subunit alcohol dehydrogenase family)